MALIKCAECGREISDQAPTCPGCGAPVAHKKNAKPSNPLWLWVVLGPIVVVGGIMLIGALTPPQAPADMCSEAAHAAHYIAAESGANPGGITAVTDDVIAKGKYPDMGDKALAALGALVSMELQEGKTPDEIATIARTACERAGKTSIAN